MIRYHMRAYRTLTYGQWSFCSESELALGVFVLFLHLFWKRTVGRIWQRFFTGFLLVSSCWQTNSVEAPKGNQSTTPNRRNHWRFWSADPLLSEGACNALCAHCPTSTPRSFVVNTVLWCAGMCFSCRTCCSIRWYWKCFLNSRPLTTPPLSVTSRAERPSGGNGRLSSLVVKVLMDFCYPSEFSRGPVACWMW